MLTILDGGMGRELIRRGFADATGLWSAKPLLDNPTAVVQAHLDYIAAGAAIITTNSYASIPSYLEKAGLASRYEALTALAGQLARAAAERAGAGTLVAGGLPPLAESYRADLALADDVARPLYANLARALEPNVDLFLCETMASAREARNAALAACDAAATRGLPVYVSYTLDETPGQGLRSGETIAAALDAVADLNIDAFLFNCTSPDAIHAGMETLARLADKPFGGYPNCFDVPPGWTLDNAVQARPRELSTQRFVADGLRAAALGASFYGGCCHVGPEHIAALAAAQRAAPPHQFSPRGRIVASKRQAERG